LEKKDTVKSLLNVGL